MMSLAWKCDDDFVAKEKEIDLANIEESQSLESKNL